MKDMYRNGEGGEKSLLCYTPNLRHVYCTSRGEQEEEGRRLYWDGKKEQKNIVSPRTGFSLRSV